MDLRKFLLTFFFLDNLLELLDDEQYVGHVSISRNL